jgi:hypothetical protein
MRSPVEYTMLRGLLLLPMAVLLGGCPSKATAPVVNPPASTAAKSQQMDGSADPKTPAPPVPPKTTNYGKDALPEGWPAELPVYPEALYNGGFRTVTNGHTTLGIAMDTDAADTDVDGFYRAAASAAGYGVSSDNRRGDAHIVIYQSPTHRFTVTIPGMPGTRKVSLHLMDTPGEAPAEPGTSWSEQQELPPGFPEILAPYPGATILSASELHGVATMTLRTSDGDAEVQQFYSRHFLGRGYVKTSEFTLTGTTAVYEGAAGTVNVSSGPMMSATGESQSGTSIVLTFTPGKAPTPR